MGNDKFLLVSQIKSYTNWFLYDIGIQLNHACNKFSSFQKMLSFFNYPSFTFIGDKRSKDD